MGNMPPTTMQVQPRVLYGAIFIQVIWEWKKDTTRGITVRRSMISTDSQTQWQRSSNDFCQPAFGHKNDYLTSEKHLTF